MCNQTQAMFLIGVFLLIYEGQAFTKQHSWSSQGPSASPHFPKIIGVNVTMFEESLEKF